MHEQETPTSFFIVPSTSASRATRAASCCGTAAASSSGCRLIRGRSTDASTPSAAATSTAFSATRAPLSLPPRPPPRPPPPLGPPTCAASLSHRCCDATRGRVHRLRSHTACHTTAAWTCARCKFTLHTLFRARRQ
eukprot:351204-Chlamydomonas_euryale.AAC.11